ncbi:serine protease [Photobacterium sp. DA100]|uniref:serine protease n=1 Tax=Photobacterium sp. DA100 TaxID=3027472 RepID=UPI002478CDD4|nr:serine protease [Photobacterium sp. DA100]WEM43817.1 serine protease [Photobacterium sp. DA100]
MTYRFLTRSRVGIVLLFGSVLFAGCNDSSESVMGADEDEHGCKSSAGYVWCAKTAQCERPWELAEREGIDSTEEAFEAYCAIDDEN